MIDKDPLGILLLLMLGVVAFRLGRRCPFIQRLKRGEAKAHNIVELIGEVVISAFVGTATFYL